MNRLRRSLYFLAVSVVVTVIALTLRTLTGSGFFTEVTPHTPGPCTALRGLPGVADLAVDRPDRLIFISAANTRAPATKPDPRDGLYTLALDQLGAGFTKLSGTPRNFRPSALSLYRAKDGKLSLMVINRPSGADPAVEIFDVVPKNGAPTLSERSSITSGLLISPHAIAAAGPDQFYVTNDHTSRTSLGRALEDYVFLPRANVIYFDGNVFRPGAQDLTFASGIALSRDGSHAYVASTTGRDIHAYETNPFTGELKDVGELSIPSGLDNIAIDDRGDLWVAGHPKLADMASVRADPSKVTPSQVFEVTLENAVPAASRLVYASEGHQISGASTAAVDGDRLFIGAPYDSKLLVCTMR